MITRFPLLTAAAFAALTLASPVAKAEGHDHSADAAAHNHEKDHGDEQHFEAKSFEGAKDAWAFMKTKVEEAEKLVAEKNIEPVHEIGEQLGGALHTLEEKSEMVTGDAKTKLDSILQQLEKALDDLHHGADKGDADATALNLKKVKGLLPVVEGLYPQGTL